jgi:hypothetical protein
MARWGEWLLGSGNGGVTGQWYSGIFGGGEAIGMRDSLGQFFSDGAFLLRKGWFRAGGEGERGREIEACEGYMMGILDSDNEGSRHLGISGWGFLDCDKKIVNVHPSLGSFYTLVVCPHVYSFLQYTTPPV